MSKTQRILRLLSGNSAFILLTLTLLVGLFIFLSPKISSQILPFKRQAILSEFISSTKQRGAIDPQAFWKFREFYSPGYFAFSRIGLENNLISQVNKEIGISYDEKAINLTFLDFISPLVKSLDMLTTQTDLSRIIDGEKLPKKDILFANKNSIIYQDGVKSIKIVALFDNAQMRQANGFIDANGKDKKLAENKNWLSITLVEE